MADDKKFVRPGHEVSTYDDAPEEVKVNAQEKEEKTLPSYFVAIPSEDGESSDYQTWDEERFQNNKDDLHREFPDALMMRASAYSPDSEIAEHDYYQVSLPDGETQVWDSERFRNNKDALLKEYPDASINRLSYYDYDWEKRNELQQKIATLEKEDSPFIEEYRKVMKEAASLAGKGVSNRPQTDYINEHKSEYASKTARLEALRREYTMNPYVIAEREAGKVKTQEILDEATRMRKHWAAAADETGLSDFDIDRTLEYTGEYGEALNYDTAVRLAKHAMDVYNAPSKYDSSNGFVNMLKGARDIAKTEDFWTLGLSSIADNMKIGGLLREVQGKLGSVNWNEVKEEDVLKALSPSETAAVMAFLQDGLAQSQRAYDLSIGYQSGQTATDSIGFMAQFLLTGGVAESATKAAGVAAKKLTMALLKKMGMEGAAGIVEAGALKVGTSALQRAMLGKLGTSTAAKAVTRATVGAVTAVPQFATETISALAKSLVMEPLQTGTYKALSEQFTQIDDSGKLVDAGETLAKAYADQLIEVLSENAGESLERILDRPLKYIGMTSWGKALARTKAAKLLKEGGYHGYFGEISEEWYGNALRVWTGVDPDALKNFTTVDQQLITYTSFAPMALFGLGTSAGQAKAAKRGEEKERNNLVSAMVNAGYSKDTAENLVNIVAQMDTAEQMSSQLTPFINQIATENGAASRTTVNLTDAVFRYANALARAKTIDGAIEEDADRRREELEGEISERVSGGAEQNRAFWTQKTEGELTSREVREITVDGEHYYVVDYTPDGRLYCINAETGKPFFTQEDNVGRDTGTLPIKDYLNLKLTERKETEEQERMRNERHAQMEAVRKRTQVGTQINTNTKEDPVMVTVVKTEGDGVIVQDAEGETFSMTWSEVANAEGTPIEVRTDQQIEDSEADTITEGQETKDSLNMRMSGQTFEYNGVTLSNPRIVGDVYADESGTVQAMVMAEDQIGVTSTLTIPLESLDAMFPDTMPEAQVQESQMAQDESREEKEETDPLPMRVKADGTTVVDQTALWNQNPRRWAEWNDAQRQDGGQNSRAYIENALAVAQKDLNELQKAYAQATDFDQREALEGQIAESEKRVQELTALLTEYTPQEKETETAPEEVKTEVKDRKRAAVEKAITDAVNELASKLGVKVVIHETVDTVTNKSARAAIESGTAVDGWYETKTGEVHFYLPNMESAEQAQVTVLHEVVAHKGIKDMLGEKNFNELLDNVWDSLSPMGKRKYAAYILTQRLDPSAITDAEFTEFSKDRSKTRKAADEFIAYATESMTEAGLDLAEEKSAWDKFVLALKNFFSRLGFKYRVDEGMVRDLITMSYQRMEDIAEREAERLRIATAFAERRQEALTEQMDSRPVEVGDIDPADFRDARTEDGDALFHTGAIKADEKVYRELLKAAGFKKKEVEELFDTVHEAVTLIDQHLNILDFGFQYDIETERPFSPLKPNSDKLYKLSLDFSTICRKRILQQMVQARLQETIGRILTREENVEVRNRLEVLRDALDKVNGMGMDIEVACALCYVEAARLKSPKVMQAFIDDAPGAMRLFFAKRASTKGGVLYDKIREAETEARKKLLEKPRLSKSDRAALEADLYCSLKALSGASAAAIRKAKADAWEAYEPSEEEQVIIDRSKSLTVQDIKSAAAIRRLAENEPEIFMAYSSKVREATKSKGIEDDVWYRAGDLERAMTARNYGGLIEQMNRENGLRSQSWSDFQVIHLMDYIAATIDLASMKSKLQAYTKVPDYVELMGKTGAMINLSLIPMRKYNGALEFDPLEGMPYDIALALREKYPNTAGTIAIATNDEQLVQMLADPTIDYVIPYHKSGLPATLRKKLQLDTWKSYESVQEEKKRPNLEAAKKAAEKRGVALLSTQDPNWQKPTLFSDWFNYEELKSMSGIDAMKEAQKRYLDICAERGLRPKFPAIAENENYWKVLIDRKMINQITGELIEQKPVRPVFDKEQVLRILKDEIARYGRQSAVKEKVVEQVAGDFFVAHKIGTVEQAENIYSGYRQDFDINSLVYPEKTVEAEEVPESDNPIMLHIGRARKEMMKSRLRNKLTAMTDAQLIETVDEIERLGEEMKEGGDSKFEDTLVDWVSRGLAVLPQDEKRVLTAYGYARRFRVDTKKIENLIEFIEATGMEVERRDAERNLINPDTIPQFTNKTVISKAHNIVVYNVEDSREGQFAVRRIVDSHFGKSANPWCLITRAEDGDTLTEAWKYWNRYKSIGKKIAFQDGKLIAFRASSDHKETWWDRRDRPHAEIPITLKLAIDGKKIEVQAKPDYSDSELLDYDYFYSVNENGVEETFSYGELSSTRYDTERNGVKESVSIDYEVMGLDRHEILETVKTTGATIFAIVVHGNSVTPRVRSYRRGNVDVGISIKGSATAVLYDGGVEKLKVSEWLGCYVVAKGGKTTILESLDDISSEEDIRELMQTHGDDIRMLVAMMEEAKSYEPRVGDQKHTGSRAEEEEIEKAIREFNRKALTPERKAERALSVIDVAVNKAEEDIKLIGYSVGSDIAKAWDKYEKGIARARTDEKREKLKEEITRVFDKFFPSTSEEDEKFDASDPVHFFTATSHGEEFAKKFPLLARYISLSPIVTRGTPTYGDRTTFQIINALFHDEDINQVLLLWNVLPDRSVSLVRELRDRYRKAIDLDLNDGLIFSLGDRTEDSALLLARWLTIADDAKEGSDAMLTYDHLLSGYHSTKFYMSQRSHGAAFPDSAMAILEKQIGNEELVALAEMISEYVGYHEADELIRSITENWNTDYEDIMPGLYQEVTDAAEMSPEEQTVVAEKIVRMAKTYGHNFIAETTLERRPDRTAPGVIRDLRRHLKTFSTNLFDERLDQILGQEVGDDVQGFLNLIIDHRDDLRERPFDEASKALPESEVLFHTAELETINSGQKSTDGRYADDADLEGDIMFHLSKNNREVIGKWLDKWIDARTQGEEAEESREELLALKKRMLDYIDTIKDATTQLCYAKWFCNGSIRMGEEDMPKVEQAVAVAKKHNTDPLRYDSPMTIINQWPEDIKEKPIDPDTVSTLHRHKTELANGIAIYDVDEGEESRQNMRKIINTHFGKDCSPWCVLQGDGDGNLTEQSAYYWNHYDAYPKMVAFKDGRLVAFSANSSNVVIWWDRQNHSHKGIPAVGKIPNDRLKRSGSLILSHETGEIISAENIFRGNKKNGEYVEYFDLEDQPRLVTHYKDGKRVGTEVRYYVNGNVEYMLNYSEDGDIQVGVQRGYFSDGQIQWEWESDEYGNTINMTREWYSNGQLKLETPFSDNMENGTAKTWYMNGQLESVINFEDGEKEGTFKSFYRDGTIEEEGSYHKGRLVGTKREYAPNGNLTFEGTYKKGEKIGVCREFFPEGPLKRVEEFDDKGRVKREVWFFPNGRLQTVKLVGRIENRRETVFFLVDNGNGYTVSKTFPYDYGGKKGKASITKIGTEETISLGLPYLKARISHHGGMRTTDFYGDNVPHHKKTFDDFEEVEFQGEVLSRSVRHPDYSIDKVEYRDNAVVKVTHKDADYNVETRPLSEGENFPSASQMYQDLKEDIISKIVPMDGMPSYEEMEWYESALHQENARAFLGWDGTMFHTAERDAEYREAVESGDREKTQAMVDEAAKMAGAILNTGGEPLKLYHGTPRFGFTEFWPGKVIFTSTARIVAANYGGDGYYASVRDIRVPIKDNSTVENIISNWENLTGQKARVADSETVEKVKTKNEKVARGIAAKLSKMEADYTFPGSEEEASEVRNAVAWIAELFYDVAGAEESGNTGKALEEIIRKDIEWYKKSKQVLKDYNIKHGGEVLKDRSLTDYLNYLLGYEVGDAAIDIEYGYYNAIKGRVMLTMDGSSLTDPESLVPHIEEYQKVGAYQLYGFAQNILEIDCAGHTWYNLDYNGMHNTDEIALWARQNGYDGIHFKDVYDYGDKADDYAFFESGMVKSADPVTYDAEGNVIPLSERFSDSNDIRFHNRMAPNGKQSHLTQEQWDMVRTEEFKRWFGDWENDPEHASKILDENGEPKVVYHQTNRTSLMEKATGRNWDDLNWEEREEWERRDDFDENWEEEDFYTFSNIRARRSVEMPAYFFAPEYDKYHEYGKRTIAAFLNIKNPVIDPTIEDAGVYNDSGEKAMQKYIDAGYDGFIRMADEENVDEYGAFFPNQIKSAEENNGDFDPDNDDIRFRVEPNKRGYGVREDGTAASRRALEAEADGRYTAGKFRQNYHLTRQAFDVLNTLGAIESNEWHHTGKAMKKSDYYGWNDDTTAEKYAANKKEIDSLVSDIAKRDWTWKQRPEAFDYYIREKAEQETDTADLSAEASKLQAAVYADKKLSDYDKMEKAAQISREFFQKRETRRQETAKAYNLEDLRKEHDALVDAYNRSLADESGKEAAYMRIADILGLNEKTARWAVARQGQIAAIQAENEAKWEQTVKAVNSDQKKTDGNYVSNSDLDLLFHTSKNTKQVIDKWMDKWIEAKVNGETDAEDMRQRLLPLKQKMFDFVDKINDTSTQLCYVKWFCNGSIRFGEEDLPKVEQAVTVAKKHKADPLQYDSPMTIINQWPEEVKEKPIDPDTVSTLHRHKTEMANGIVVYDVDEGKESHQNMREIINTHFGKDCSPWCVLQGDGDGNLTEDSFRYWDNYDAYPKMVAFKDGKLIAFSANDDEEIVWWDRQDHKHIEIPATGKIPNDRLKRSGTFLYGPDSGEHVKTVDIFKGNQQNGEYIKYFSLESDQPELIEHYKNGELRGEYIKYYENGNKKMEGCIGDNGYSSVGKFASYYEDGQRYVERTYDADGREDGDVTRWYPNGIVKERMQYRHGEVVGIHEKYAKNGTLISRVERNQNGALDGIKEFWSENGTPLYLTTFKNGELNGESKKWFSNGQLEKEENYVQGKLDGIRREYYRGGILSVEEKFIQGERRERTRYRPDGSLFTMAEYYEGGMEKRTKVYRPSGKLHEIKLYPNFDLRGSAAFTVIDDRESDGVMRYNVVIPYGSEGYIKQLTIRRDSSPDGWSEEVYNNFGKRLFIRKGTKENEPTVVVYEERPAGRVTVYSDHFDESGNLESKMIVKPGGDAYQLLFRQDGEDLPTPLVVHMDNNENVTSHPASEKDKEEFLSPSQRYKEFMDNVYSNAVYKDELPTEEEKTQAIAEVMGGDGEVRFHTSPGEMERDYSEKMGVHDLVATLGLRGVLGNERATRFFMDVFHALSPEEKGTVVRLSGKYGMSIERGVEEYLSTEALKDGSDVWGRVKGVFSGLADALGVEEGFGRNDMRWMSWQSFNSGRRNDAILKAQRIVLGKSLGFDTKTLSAIEDADRDILMHIRDVDSITSAAALYNNAVADLGNRMSETWIDQFQSVNDLVEAIETVTGKKAKAFEDVRMALNQQSSKGLADMNEWERTYWNPLVQAVKDFMEALPHQDIDEVSRYVMLKHGLERNEKFAARDAKNEYRAIYETELKRIDAMNVSDSQKDALKDAAKDELDRHIDDVNNRMDAVYDKFRERDYGGITALLSTAPAIDRSQYSSEEEYLQAVKDSKQPYFNGDIRQLESLAQQMVDDYESEAGADRVDNLWKRINAATKATLKHQFDANVISAETLDAVSSMFEYYVPLRGFKEKTAPDIYDYYNSDQHSSFTAPLLKAHGRTSEAESPFGVIGQMASSAIAQDVKNNSKLALWFFLNNRKRGQDIAVLGDQWYEFRGQLDASGKKIFEPVFFDFPDDLTTDARKKMYDDWEKDMEKKVLAGDAMRGRDGLKLDYVINIPERAKSEHAISLKVGGKDKVIYINGNPRAAQAINGDLNIEKSQDYQKFFGKALRWFAGVSTQYNPEFWVSNLQRDLLFSIMAVNIKESPEYQKAFLKNLFSWKRILSLSRKYSEGTLGNSRIEQDYKDFVDNGGVTGFTVVRSNEVWDEALRFAVNENESTVHAVLRKGFEKVSEFGEAIEQMTRFSAYLTSRDMGKSIIDSVADAKELTVNFNRKGSGKALSWEETARLKNSKGRPLSYAGRLMAIGFSVLPAYGRRALMFFNAAIQGLNTCYELVKRNPAKAAGWVSAYFILGVLNAAVHAMFDDDDDYLDIPDYERRNNALFGWDGVYFKWAMPQEMRVAYAWGDMMVNHALGREPHQFLPAEMAKALMDISPINPTEGISNLTPSALNGFIDVARNKDYKGSPVFKENIYISEEENTYVPNFTKVYKDTGIAYIKVSQFLNTLSGGDYAYAGKIDQEFGRWANPAAWEHIIESFGGGALRTATGVWKTLVEVPLTEEEFSVRQTPFLRRVMTLNDERSRNAHVTDLFYYYEGIAKSTKRRMKAYTEAKDDEKLARLSGSDDFAIYSAYTEYQKKVKDLEKKMKTAEGKERLHLMGIQDQYRKEMIQKIAQREIE